jgi:ATP-dependent Lhr-like helicase
VWAGLVTNDTFAPVRALAWPKRSAAAPPRARGTLVPPEAAGRWALAFPGEDSASTTARAHALASTLLERYAVVTREAAAAEGLAGGFSAVYPVLKAMEEGGRVRRGYFIEGLGGAQFALPGAVDRLRAERDAPADAVVNVVAATDPANPYGATIPWPGRDGEDRRSLQRAAGAYVVLVDGEPMLYLDRGGRGLATFPLVEGETRMPLAIGALATHMATSQRRSLTIERVDGAPVADAPLGTLLRAAGFVPGYKGLTFRVQRSEAAGARGR